MADYQSIHTGAIIDAAVSAVVAGQAGIQGVKVNGEALTPDDENKVDVTVPGVVQTTGQSTTNVMSQKAVTDAIAGGGGVTVVQTTGQSTTDVMSQKAVTDELDTKAESASYTATLSSSGWTGTEAPYTQTVNVTGILSTDVPIIDISTVTLASITDWACVSKIETADGSITATCLAQKPSNAIDLRILVVR